MKQINYIIVSILFSAIFVILYYKTRIRKPMKRQKDSWTEISWEEALDRTAFSLKKIIKRV